ncbi:hypothetical protein BDY24DRAFT_415643 [Mrakia frigida]|uniref:uncharacterized protein n=1 Tax=Mrakia frigida TaxID=29902 RepID=UPI003FCBF8F8
MAPKRKADDTQDKVDPSPYHPNFPLYPEADIVVESSNKKKDGHLLIKIEEAGELFEVFLRYAPRGRLLIEGQPPPNPPKLFDKYDSPALARYFLIEHLPRLVMDPVLPRGVRGACLVAGTDAQLPLPVEVFAVASIHGREDLAQRSLRLAPSGLGHLSLSLLSRLPTKVVRDFSSLYGKVLTTHGYSWIKAGDDFKLGLGLFNSRADLALFSHHIEWNALSRPRLER